MLGRLHFFVSLGARAFRALFVSRSELLIGDLARCQQVAALKRGRSRPPLHDVDRAFWVALRRSRPGWASCLLLVDSDTVARWDRERFRHHWAKLAHQNRRPDHPRIDAEDRRFIRLMAHDGWRAPGVHRELLKLGFAISEITVTRHMPCRPLEPDKAKRCMAFLRFHKDAIAAMDCFTVPTVSFRVLYVLFVIEHGRRRVLHFNVTANPTSARVSQQLRESFPFDTAPRRFIFDRDSISNPADVRFVRAMGIEPARTANRSPWQNPVAGRWIGSCRCERLEHVVVLSDGHLTRLISSYLEYHQEERSHLGSAKDAPATRPVSRRPSPTAKVVALPRVGGIHHRYQWREAA